MKVAVVGAGLGGIVAAYTLARAGVEVVVYEKENDLGGHARTFSVDGIDMDLGFMVCNRVTDSSTMRFFEELGVDLELSDMSFSVSLDNGKGYEWSSSNGLPGLFAQKTNVLNPFFWQMLYEIHNFKQHVVEWQDDLTGLFDDKSNQLCSVVRALKEGWRCFPPCILRNLESWGGQLNAPPRRVMTIARCLLGTVWSRYSTLPPCRFYQWLVWPLPLIEQQRMDRVGTEVGQGG